MHLIPEGISGLYFRPSDLSISVYHPSKPFAVADHFINLVGDGLHMVLRGRVGWPSGGKYLNMRQGKAELSSPASGFSSIG